MLGDQSIRQSFHQSYWPVCGFSYIPEILDPGLLLPKPRGDTVTAGAGRVLVGCQGPVRLHHPRGPTFPEGAKDWQRPEDFLVFDQMSCVFCT